MIRQMSDPLHNGTRCLSLERLPSDPLSAHIRDARVSIRLAVSKKKSISGKHQQSPLTIEEVDAICADIIVALLEQVSDLKDVSASEEEEDVCSICLDAIVIESAVSSNDDVNNLPDIKTLTDIKTLLCGDNPTIFSN
jgi:hypothetical protein